LAQTKATSVGSVGEWLITAVPPTSVVGDERLRLFCALQLPDEVLAALTAWQERHLSAGRIVPPGNLHVTVAFLGWRPAGDVVAVTRELEEASAAAEPASFRPLRYRETRSVGMVVLEDVGGVATAFADDLGERLERLGVYRRENRPWLAHVTVLRFKERPRLAPPVDELVAFGAVRSALYRSALGPAGARYEVLESVALGGR
jgi:2'-5' RNA ligase